MNQTRGCIRDNHWGQCSNLVASSTYNIKIERPFFSCFFFRITGTSHKGRRNVEKSVEAGTQHKMQAYLYVNVN